MAKIDIKKLKRLDKQNNREHEEARGTFTTFIYNDKKYFQIDTYGSSRRECTEKISQSFQIDKESAEEFIKILNREFKED